MKIITKLLLIRSFTAALLLTAASTVAASQTEFETPTAQPPAEVTVYEETPLYVNADDPDFSGFKALLSKYLAKPAPPSNSAQTKSCEAAYDDLFKKPVFTISVYWGYNNTEQGIADDPHFKKEFIKNITDRCRPGLVLCDFKKVSDHDPLIGGETFVKTVVNPSRRKGKPAYLQVRLKLANAALTSVQYKNEGVLWVQQYYRSVGIEKAYLKSLNSDDVVLYSGHARYGTGIGFRPFETASGPWVRAWVLQPMKTSVEQTLSNAKTPAKILGLLSCDSDAHYGRALHQVSPTSSLILTRNPLAIRDTQTVLFASLNSLLSGHCEEQFQTSMRIGTRTFYWYKGDPEPTDTMALSPKLYNFFENDTDQLADRKPLRDAFRTEYQIRSIYPVE